MLVQIVMGSTSDQKVADKAVEILEKLQIPYEVTVASAHRVPQRVEKVAKNNADIFIF